MTAAPTAPVCRGRLAWFNCAAGVAGDMLLGALVDAGADADAVLDTIDGLGVDGFKLTFERVTRGGVSATWANVVVNCTHGDVAGHHRHRPVGEILELLAGADLADRVRARAAAVFTELAAAEGAVHGVDPADVELHEVGSLDAIVDVVGIAAALESLDIGGVHAGTIGVANGLVHTAHGVLPHPSPAVARMIAEHCLPVAGVDAGFETATPTGVAVVAALSSSFGPPPTMRPDRTGFGAGRADPQGRANVVNVLVGDPIASTDVSAGGDGVAVRIDSNVDDVTGEVLAHAIATLMDAGALDAWATPIVMKKGRPAHTVSVLTAPADADALRAVLVTETGTLGTRSSVVARAPEPREESTVDVGGVAVRVKRAGGRVKVEFDDAVAASRRLDLPLREILFRASRPPR